MNTRIFTLISLVSLVSLTAIMLFFGVSDGVSITLNGQEVDNPLWKGLGGVFGVVVTMVVIACSSLIMLMLLSGMGLTVLAISVCMGLLLFGIALPFLLPIILPLCIVLIFAVRKSKSNKELSTAQHS